MANVFSGRYPQSLRKAIAHAGRLNDVLQRLEKEAVPKALVGRADELRLFVRGAVAEWQAARRDDAQTVEAIAAHLRDVHRTAGKTLGMGTRLACCSPDDASASTTTTTGLSLALSVALGGALGGEGAGE